MHWAVDYLGRVVAADQKEVYWSELSCPCCGEAVYRRRGVERRAHFAHYSYSGDRSCEFYVPTVGVVGVVGSPTPLALPNKSKNDKDETLRLSRRAVLCIFVSNTNVAQLKLRLPVDRNLSGLEGGVLLNSSYGEIPIQFSKLAKPFFTVLPWNCPPAVCAGAPIDESVVQQINDALNQLQFSKNYFRAGLAGGVLLLPHEALLIEESYWLVTQDRVREEAPPGIKFELVNETKGWYRYRVELSKEIVCTDASVLSKAQKFLGRNVKSAEKRIDIQKPLPHHYDFSGAPIFGEETNEIYVSVPKNSHVEIAGESTNHAKVTINDELGSVACISELSLGDLVIIVDGSCLLQARLDQCEQFRPFGIRVSSGGGFEELFTENAEKLIRNSNVKKTLQVPSKRVLKLLKLKPNEIVSVSDDTTLHVHEHVRSLNAENFGRVEKCSIENIGPNEVAEHKWVGEELLFGLVLRDYGPVLANELKSLNSSSSQVERFVLSHGLTSLYPYIVEMKRQRR